MPFVGKLGLALKMSNSALLIQVVKELYLTCSLTVLPTMAVLVEILYWVTHNGMYAPNLLKGK